MKLASKFAVHQSGAVAIEYALIVSLIALALIPSANGVGINLGATFYRIAASISLW